MLAKLILYSLLTQFNLHPRNFRKVVMGFTFDKKIIEPQNLKYHTKVYHLLRLYPFDEPTDEFYFDVNEYLYK